MQKQKPYEILRSMGLLYWAMLLGLVMLVALSAWFVNHSGAALGNDPQSQYIVNTVLIFLLIAIAPLSYIVPQRMIAAIDRTLPLEDKLLRYKLPVLIRYFLLNMAGSLIAVGFMLSGNTNLMYLQAIVMLFFLVYKPSPFKVASDLDLNEQERQKLMPEN